MKALAPCALQRRPNASIPTRIDHCPQSWGRFSHHIALDAKAIPFSQQSRRDRKTRDDRSRFVILAPRSITGAQRLRGERLREDRDAVFSRKRNLTVEMHSTAGRGLSND